MPILVILYSDRMVSDRTVSVSSLRRDPHGPGSGNNACSRPVLEARPEVRHARVGWLVSAEASLLGVQRSSSPCVPTCHLLCTSGPTLLYLPGPQALWIRACTLVPQWCWLRELEMPMASSLPGPGGGRGLLGQGRGGPGGEKEPAAGWYGNDHRTLCPHPGAAHSGLLARLSRQKGHFACPGLPWKTPLEPPLPPALPPEA